MTTTDRRDADDATFAAEMDRPDRLDVADIEADVREAAEGPSEVPPSFPVAAFWGRVEKTDDCWLWIGRRTNGYGVLMHKKRNYKTHRVAWVLLRSEIPDGLVIDHLCRVRNCVNPEHMELVETRVNVLRGIGITAENAQKTHCPAGHAYEGDNVLIEAYRPGSRSRVCRSCRVARTREWGAGKVTCPCGSSMRRANLARHRRESCTAATRAVAGPQRDHGGEGGQ